MLVSLKLNYNIVMKFNEYISGTCNETLSEVQMFIVFSLQFEMQVKRDSCMIM